MKDMIAEILGSIIAIGILFVANLAVSVGVLYVSKAPINLFSVSLTVITTLLVSYLLASLLKVGRKA